METANPLFTNQRERAGSTTFDKFDYQYHWALFELLQRYQREEVSIVFVELHEDVVFADSESSDAARFLFCQVKCTPKNWTRTSLLRRSKLRADTDAKNSVLGKMLLGPCAKKIETRLDGIELVATSSFSLKLKQDGVELNRTRLEELHAEEVSAITTALHEELGDTALLHKVVFRRSELPTEAYARYTIGLIAEILANRSPGSKVDANGVYLSLIDELHRKGKVAWDYARWDELVLKKGVLTSRVAELFATLSDSVDVSTLVQYGVKQFEHWGCTPRQMIIYEKLLRKHALKARTDRSLTHLSVQQTALRNLEEILETNEELSLEMLEVLIKHASPEIRAYAPNEDDLKAFYVLNYLNR